MANLREPVTDEGTTRREEIKKRTTVGGAAIETIGGVVAVILAVIGLAGFEPVLIAGVACLAVGVALLFEGLALGAQFYDDARNGVEGEAAEVGVEAMAGLAGVTLGVLALADAVSPYVLLPIAALVMGAGMLFGASPIAQASRRRTYAEPNVSPKVNDVSRYAGNSAWAAHAFAGIAAVILGILGLLDLGRITLGLVAFLVLGATLVLSSAAFSGRVVAMVRR
jgi:hypothetical protein